MSTTWTEELEQAATRAEIQAQETDERTAGVRWQYLRGIHEAEARCLRQRAAWVRELEAKANAYPLAMTYERRTIAALTGPIPSPAPCAGCLPADGDYGDGPPPMVLGRHVEGCSGDRNDRREGTMKLPRDSQVLRNRLKQAIWDANHNRERELDAIFDTIEAYMTEVAIPSPGTAPPTCKQSLQVDPGTATTERKET